MSAFQKFKQRKAQEKSQLPKTQTATPMPKVKKHIGDKLVEGKTALSLLAKLLNVTEAQAIAEAEKYIVNNITFFEEREAETVTLEINQNEHGIHTKAEAEALAEVFNNTSEQAQTAADSINEAATEASEQLNSAASNVETTADDLAYTAADIATATEELKEATTELKKPSAVPKSSNSKSATKRKSSLKKQN